MAVIREETARRSAESSGAGTELAEETMSHLLCGLSEEMRRGDGKILEVGGGELRKPMLHVF